jgi:hypothetical protein
MLITFDDTQAILDVPDDPSFLAALRAAAVDWRFRPANASVPPLVTARMHGDAVEVRRADGEMMLLSPVSAACSIVVDLLGDYIHCHPDQLCLHCGAVEVGGRLVVFPSRSRAGKSTLVARLAADGHRVFGDDVLPISADDRSGIGLGLSPRLRLPLPKRATAPFRGFVDDHAGASDERYLYLALADLLARRDDTAELGAIVLLDRRDDGPAFFARAPRTAVLKALIAQNFSVSAPAGTLIDRMHALMDRLPLYLLRYSDLDEAAALIGRMFAVWPAEPVERETPDDFDRALHVDGTAAAAQTTHAADVKFVQNPGIRLRSVDGEMFLADAADAGIHHLNTVGVGIWNLLAEPTDRTEATEVLMAAFPDVAGDVIAADVAALFAVLAQERLILPRH